MIYSGCELEHWREPFEGNVCSQVFLHYNHANGPFAKTNLFDKRPLLGVPKVMALVRVTLGGKRLGYVRNNKAGSTTIINYLGQLLWNEKPTTV